MRESNFLKTAVFVLGIGLVGVVVVLAIVVRSLNSTQDELEQAQADLIRVEEGAAGSAIVSAQVIEFARQVGDLEPQVAAGLDQAITELETFSNSSLEFAVAIDETVVIDTEITIDRDFSFPIDETINIDQAVDTTIEIDTGLGFQVPVDVNVPVNVDVPIQLDVDVPINETVPVVAEVPVNLDVPIEIDIAETELVLLTEQLSVALREIQAVVSDLAG